MIMTRMEVFLEMEQGFMCIAILLRKIKNFYHLPVEEIFIIQKKVQQEDGLRQS